MVDILQLPAFLARQTDLVVAMAETGNMINVEKAAVFSTARNEAYLKKFREANNQQVMLGERGSCFGYNNLVVDMLGMDEMKSMALVIFDATHAQRPGGRSDSADGRRAQAAQLARSGMALVLSDYLLKRIRTNGFK